MSRPTPSRGVKIYRVGGSVRDELIGRPDADRDWVVVGATPEWLIASGFRPVGRDFPVFLHPGHARGIRARAHRAQARARLPRLRILRLARRDARGRPQTTRPHGQCDGACRGRNADRPVRRCRRPSRRDSAARVAGVCRGSVACAAGGPVRGAPRIRGRAGNARADARHRGRRRAPVALARTRLAGTCPRLDGADAVAAFRGAA